jgi:hypothetical protein
MNMSKELVHCFHQGFKSSPLKRLVPREEGGDLNYLDIQQFQTQISLSPQDRLLVYGLIQNFHMNFPFLFTMKLNFYGV